MHIYTCIYIYIMCIYTYIYACIFAYIHVYIYIHVIYAHVYVYIQMHAKYAHILYIYMLYIYLCWNKSPHEHTCIHPHIAYTYHFPRATTLHQPTSLTTLSQLFQCRQLIWICARYRWRDLKEFSLGDTLLVKIAHRPTKSSSIEQVSAMGL